MAELGTKPYRVMDRRSSTGYVRENTLLEAATTSNQRKRIPRLGKDSYALVSQVGRDTLMWSARILYGGDARVKGVIDQMASMASENTKPVFDGEDKEWGEEAEEALRQQHKIVALEGPHMNRQALIRCLMISMLRDGDATYLLTSTPDGYPKIQSLGAHRIYSGSNAVVDDERWKGRAIIDGRIVDDYRRVLAYRVYDNARINYKDIPARHMGCWFRPDWVDQVSGFSALAAAVYPFLDLKESREFELMAQKVSATYTVLEQTETGRFDPSSGILRTAADFSTDSGSEHQPITTTEQLLEGGLIRRVKAGKGCAITAHNYDRPGANTQNFQSDVLRDACLSLGWNYWFSVDPTKPGSGPFRVIVDTINRWLHQSWDVIDRMCLHMDSYAILKLMELGVLRWSDDWWRWKYQHPADITADRKYDSDVDVQEIANNLSSPQIACAKRSAYWEDVQDDNIRATLRKKKRTVEIGVDEFDMTEEEAKAEAEKQPAEDGKAKEGGTQPNRTRREPTDDNGEDEKKDGDKEDKE